MTDRRCGTCDFWDRDRATRCARGELAVCRAPVPASVCRSREDIHPCFMLDTEGATCAAWKEKTGAV